MASNGNSLAVLREIHKARVKQIDESYRRKYEELEKKAKAEVESSKEGKTLKKQEDELQERLEKVREKSHKIEEIAYQNHNIPRCEWHYKDQLLAEEHERFEKALEALLSPQGEGGGE